MNKVYKWPILVALIGLVVGSASALFLWALDLITRWRGAQPALIYLLPFIGFTVGWIYLRWGQSVEGGQRLLLEEIHEPRRTVPLRMSALILLGTLLTHLGGGSAGREGTAVQMGGSLADQLGRLLKMLNGERKIVLMTGMSAGFASVFGVPWAGAIFGLEVLGRGRLAWRAVVPCLVAAFLAHWVCLFWGIQHTAYATPSWPQISVVNIGWLLVTGSVFGACAWLFAHLIEETGGLFRRWVPYAPLRPLIGGLVILAGFYCVGNLRYAGLGVPAIQESLRATQSPWDWALKMLFTVMTLGSGFKGGEVTPLLFIGSTLGNALTAPVPLPMSFLGALGFVAVFAGAAHTPLACAVMGMEIFGVSGAPFLLVVCLISDWVAGSSGIYRGQNHLPRFGSRPK